MPPALIAAALTLLLLGAGAMDAYPASAKPARAKILSPKPGATLPARPLTVAIRKPSGANLASVRLNGTQIKRGLRARRGGIHEVRVSPTHGLDFGRNRLAVATRPAAGAKARTRVVRFTVRARQPLAAAGRDRVIDSGERLRLRGGRSISHLEERGGPGDDDLDHRWRVLDAPAGVDADDVLARERSKRAVFRADETGTYRIGLTVTAEDGESGSDTALVQVEVPTPHIDAVAKELRERNPGTEGKVWGVSHGNELPDNWLLQTPDCWQAPNCGPGPLPPSAAPITSRITQIIAGAEHSVDFSALWPLPDGPFRAAIVDGLKGAVAAGNKPTFRVITGTPPTQFSSSKFKSWVDQLVADVGGDLPVQVAAMSTYRQYLPPAATSWNHSKVIAVDGRSAIVGGMNYWAADYLQVKDPANDVSVTLDGPAAADVTDFEDVMWGWVCANRSKSLYVTMRTSNVSGCVDKAKTSKAPADGAVPVMTLGRLGNGIDVPGQSGRKSPPIPDPPLQGSACNALQRQVSDTNTNREYEYRNPGETGLRELIRSAEDSVFIAQQDMFGCIYDVEAYFDERVFAALGQKVVDGVPVRIVVSQKGSKTGGADYSNGWEVAEVAKVLRQVVAKLKPKADARKLVCDGVGLAGVRTLDAATWPNGNLFANHSKVVWVDGDAFYVGSQNLYPARLQELGLLIEEPSVAGQFKRDYIDPLWERSRQGAVIDPARGVCGSF